MRHYLFVIVGTSGSGKSVLNELLAQNRPDLERVISCTTRKPREGEVDKVHYRFFDEEQFVEKMERGEFVEFDQPFIHDEGSPNQFDRYGHLVSDFALLETSHCYADMTEKGVAALQKLGFNAVYIRLDAVNKTVTERDKDRAQGDAKRAAISVRFDYVVRNDHALPDKRGIQNAITEICGIIDQYVHPEG